MKTSKINEVIIAVILALLYTAIPCIASEDIADSIKGKFVFDGIRDPKLGWGVYVLDMKDKEPKFLGPKMGSSCWLADGTKIASTKEDGIVISNEDGKVLEFIKTPIPRPGLLTYDSVNDKILFATRGENAKWLGQAKRLYLYSFKTKEHKLIFDVNAKCDIISPSFSPDGKKILFTMTDEKDGLYIMNVDGSNLEKINKATGITIGWFPDGKSVCYDTNIGEDGNLMNPKPGYGYLFKYNIETKTTERLREFGFTLFGRLSKDGKYIYYVKPIGRGGHVICVSPIDDEKTEIQITKPVLLGNSGKYSEEFSPDWYQGN